MNTETLHQTIEKITLIAGSGTLAFVIAMLLTPWFHRQLIKFKLGKQIRDDALSGEKATLFAALHAKKSGTPTMGGLLIWGTILIVVVLSRGLSAAGIFEHSLLNRNETWIPLFTLVTCGMLGAVDDYFNIRGIGKTKGLNAKWKMIWLTIFATAGAWWFYSKLGYTRINIPFPGIESLELGWLYIPVFIFVIISTANAVNFTDGLDGLASGLLIFAFGAFGILSYTEGMFILAALCAVISGAILAFLWFNVPPAKFYMGDTGSLALGATLGVIAMLSEQTLILPIVGIMFVVEGLSVAIQLTSKKFFHRKVFKIAPIHHHFEQCGWKEFTIVMRFWIIGGIFAVFGTILGLINIAL
jgi:phospho-N-acetylmuramoyl-pentapeptide-transferase